MDVIQHQEDNTDNTTRRLGELKREYLMGIVQDKPKARCPFCGGINYSGWIKK